MTQLPINVFHVDTVEGVKIYVICAPIESAFENGTPGQAILGQLSRPLKPGDSIEPEIFVSNRMFVDFMHQVIREHAPKIDGLKQEAQRQRTGWVYIIDQRTETPAGDVPPEDIVGAFMVSFGQVVPGSYHPNPNHQILTHRGFLQIGPELETVLLEELSKLI